MKEENREEDKSHRQGRQSHGNQEGVKTFVLAGCQAAVTESEILKAAEAVTDANDRNQLEPVIEQTGAKHAGKVLEK